jgi:hypothetical protein
MKTTRVLRGKISLPHAHRRVLVAWLLLAVLDTLSTACADDSGSAKRPFTVRDSIAWTYLLPFSPEGEHAQRVALWSPDHSHFVVQTRRGDLERNVNVNSLLLFNADEVRNYIRSHLPAEKAPVPRVLMSVDASRDEESLTNIEWLGNSEVGFIAKAADGRMQAFAADIHSGTWRQITHSDTYTVAFGLSGTSIAYYACVPKHAEQPSVVLVDSFEKTLPPLEPNESGCYVTTPVELFYARVGQSPRRVPLPAMRLFQDYKKVWLSPSGDFAVVLAPAVNAPSHWQDYRGPDDSLRYTAEWVRDDATSMDLLNRTRYLLVNLRENTIKPLLDAPTGQMSLNYTPLQAFWTKDGRSVIVTNTYLPLDDGRSAESASVRTRPAIAEVDIVTGAITRIHFEGARADMQLRLPNRIVDFEWDADAARLTIVNKRANYDAVWRQTYEKVRDRWRQVGSGALSHENMGITAEQGLNDRSRIYVSDARTATPKVLFDPNPQANQLSFGETRAIEWQDANGLKWKGGLLLPPAYVSGSRYPLVVQTHGFSPSRFLLDGPGDDRGGVTAFAAQALANAGFVVLQVEDNPPTITDDHLEGPAVAEGFRAGIEHLIADGLVDRSAVGLIAFSRTGYHAIHLVQRYPDLLAALVMSDTLQAGYSIRLFNATNAPTLAVLDRLTHGPPQLENIGEWFANNPLYSLRRSKAAVRLEAMVQGLGMWETYAVLREAGRPVEFVLYPDGSHVLQKPHERLSSQGGSVDWLRFWLQRYEDPEPEKRDQYERWRKLRAVEAPH